MMKEKECKECKGSGYITVSYIRGMFKQEYNTSCSYCGGTGTVPMQRKKN